MKSCIKWMGLSLLVLGLSAVCTSQLSAGEEPPAVGSASVEGQPPSTATSTAPCLNGYTGGECCCDGPCGPCGRFWFSGDYMHWWTKGSRIPLLAATATDPNDPLNTMVPLFGDSKVNGDDRSGFNLTAGMWLDDCHLWGIEGDYFNLGRRNNDFDSGLSNGSTILFRPYLDTNDSTSFTPPFLNAQIVAESGILAGSVTVHTQDYFQSAGLDVRRNLYCSEWSGCDGCSCGSNLLARCGAAAGGWLRVDGIMGYRFYNLSDGVDIHESLVSLSDLGGGIGVGYDVRDSFRAENEFQGIDLGIATSIGWGRWTLDVTNRFTLGGNHEIVKINGQTIVSDPVTGPEPAVPGGLLALSTSSAGPLNMGEYSRNRFCAIPQIGVTLGYQVTSNLKLHAGYDVIYWDKVVRAGEQINPLVDDRNIPGGTGGGNQNPTFSWREASFWAQGVRAGAELRY